MRNLVTVVPMIRDVMNIPDLQDGPDVFWTAENAVKSTTTAHFGQKTLTVYKMAAIMYLSDELIADSTEIDIVNFIIQLFSERIGEEEDRVITAGTGTAQPTGIITGATANQVTCAGNLSFDNMIDLEYALEAKYQKNASYLVHRTNIKELRKLKDNDGRYLWSDPVAAGQPATFHGRPVYENNFMPEATIAFGDYKFGYWLGDRQQMSVKISNDTETALNSEGSIKRVNCWKLFNKIKTISSLAWTAMSLKVQRIANESLWDSNLATSALY